MKKSVFYSLLTVFCFALCAVGFTSCDDDDDVNSYYKLDVLHSNIILPDDAEAAEAAQKSFDADMRVVKDALCNEFGIKEVEKFNSEKIKDVADSRDKSDAAIIARFDAAVASLPLENKWNGEVVYVLCYYDKIGTKIDIHEFTISNPHPNEGGEGEGGATE